MSIYYSGLYWVPKGFLCKLCHTFCRTFVIRDFHLTVNIIAKISSILMFSKDFVIFFCQQSKRKDSFLGVQRRVFASNVETKHHGQKGLVCGLVFSRSQMTFLVFIRTSAGFWNLLWLVAKNKPAWIKYLLGAFFSLKCFRVTESFHSNSFSLIPI